MKYHSEPLYQLQLGIFQSLWSYLSYDLWKILNSLRQTSFCWAPLKSYSKLQSEIRNVNITARISTTPVVYSFGPRKPSLPIIWAGYFLSEFSSSWTSIYRLLQQMEHKLLASPRIHSHHCNFHSRLCYGNMIVSRWWHLIICADQVPTACRQNDLTLSKLIDANLSAKTLGTKWPVELGQKKMIKAVRMPLGFAAKMWVDEGASHVLRSYAMYNYLQIQKDTLVDQSCPSTLYPSGLAVSPSSGCGR